MYKSTNAHLWLKYLNVAWSFLCYEYSFILNVINFLFPLRIIIN